VTVSDEAIVESCRQRYHWTEDRGVSAAEELSRRLALVRDQWQFEVVEIFAEGAGAPVLGVRRGDVGSDGGPAVLKIDLEGLGRDGRRAMMAADGRGYARVLAHDDAAGAVLLERLGAPLSEAGITAAQQVMIMLDLLLEVWPAVPMSADTPRPSKGALLADIVVEHRHRAPDHGRVLVEAERRARGLDRRGRHPVVVHGDPHPDNTLRRGTSGWAFVDPDGFAGDASYDVGVTLRDWSPQILDIADREGNSAARAWHEDLVVRVARTASLDPELIADWAFVERVTTALWLAWRGHPEQGESWLRAANILM